MQDFRKPNLKMMIKRIMFVSSEDSNALSIRLCDFLDIRIFKIEAVLLSYHPVFQSSPFNM